MSVVEWTDIHGIHHWMIVWSSYRKLTWVGFEPTQGSNWLSNTLSLNFCHLKIIHILHPCYHLKIIAPILKNNQKNNCVCLHETMQLIIMKTKIKMKNIPQRYDINRPRSRHGHKYSKYKNCLSIMMLRCIKQQLNNIWGSIYEKILSNTEATHTCWICADICWRCATVTCKSLAAFRTVVHASSALKLKTKYTALIKPKTLQNLFCMNKNINLYKLNWEKGSNRGFYFQ